MRISDWSSDVCSSDLREVEVSRARVAIEQRHGNGRPLHYQPLPAAHAAAAAPGAFSAPPSRAAVSNAVTTFFDGSSGDDPDGFAAITGPPTPGFPDPPSMGGMSAPPRIPLPRPSPAVRADR